MFVDTYVGKLVPMYADIHAHDSSMHIEKQPNHGRKSDHTAWVTIETHASQSSMVAGYG